VSNVPEQMHPKVVVRTAANAMVDFGVPDADAGSIAGGVDGMIKVEGLAFQAATLVSTAQAGTTWAEQDPSEVGLHTEVNDVINKRVAPGVRCAMATGIRDDANELELTAGAAVVQQGGQAFKWTTDVGLLTQSDGTLSERAFRARSQMQFSFQARTPEGGLVGRGRCLAGCWVLARSCPTTAYGRPTLGLGPASSRSRWRSPRRRPRMSASHSG
jgi:hypothetical protein